MCGACHVAHGTVTSQQTPLWDHELTTATHTLYASSTLDATPGQPQGISLICLSCHDGTVAVDSCGGTVGTTYIDPQFDLGTDLTNDHPISFVYDANLASADSGLHDPETTSSGIYGSIRTDLLYENSTMECEAPQRARHLAGPAPEGQQRQRALPDLPQEVSGGAGSLGQACAQRSPSARTTRPRPPA